jgi:hypothetical protein
VLEVSLADASQIARVETCMEGAHGTVIPSQVLSRAARAG